MLPIPASTRRAGPCTAALLALGLVLVATPASGQTTCPPGRLAGGQASDLWCLDLLPTARAEAARGAAVLSPARSPFGISVAADGTAIYDVAIAVEGLAEAPGSRLVAWAAPPALAPVHHLGEIALDGTLRATVALDKFLIVVTREAGLGGNAAPPLGKPFFPDSAHH